MTASLDHLIALARPVKHEANNLLGVLLGTSDILLRLAADERDGARAERLSLAAERLAALLKAWFALLEPPPDGDGIDGAGVLETMRPLLALSGGGRAIEITAGTVPHRLATTPGAFAEAVQRLLAEAAAELPRDASLAVELRATPEGACLRVAAGAAAPEAELHFPRTPG